MGLRQREEVGRWKDVRYYELDEADLDRRSAPMAKRLAGPDTFMWYWFRPDVEERDESVGWDRIPGIPFVQPPQPGETITLPKEEGDRNRQFLVLQSVRVKMDNYGWCVLREVH